MKLRKLLNEILDLKAITDTVTNMGNQLKGIQAQIPEIQKLQQDNIALTKKMDDLSKNSVQNKTGTGTVAKTGTTQNVPGGNAKATTPSTAPATGAPAPFTQSR